MFSDSKLTHDTDLSSLTDIVNSKRIYSGQNLGKYASEQKNNYKKRVAAASNLAEDGGPLLSRYDYNDYRITSEYERKVNAMDPASRSKIIKNLATENFFSRQVLSYFTICLTESMYVMRSLIVRMYTQIVIWLECILYGLLRTSLRHS